MSHSIATLVKANCEAAIFFFLSEVLSNAVNQPRGFFASAELALL
jgi:hypothetical protein